MSARGRQSTPAPAEPSPPSPRRLPPAHELRFLGAVALVCVGFVVIQLLYANSLPLNMDEFLGGYHAYQIIDELPYADYRPYKTLLGYFPQALILAAAPDTWSGLMWTKYFIVVVNGLFMAVGARVLAKDFAKSAVVAGLILFACMSTYLERSLELRVDMMTAWMGFASLLLLVRRRAGWAGVLAALSFLTSQKGVYFVAAGFATLAVLRFSSFREPQRAWRPTLAYGSRALIVLLAYLGVWSVVAGPTEVFTATFLSHADVVFDDANGPMHAKWWGQSIWRNGFYYALLGIAFWRLERLRHARAIDRVHLVALVYGAATTALCFAHSKPWPYFLVFLFPTAFVVHAAFFDAEIRNGGEGRRTVAGMSVPMLLAFVGFGMAVPLARVPHVLLRDLSAQRATVRLAESLVAEDETYFAGINFLYRREQFDRYLGILGNRTVDELEADRSLQQRLLDQMRASRMKLVISSYRTKRLPRPLKRFLDDNYTHLWANVDIYAPTIEGPGAFTLLFAGEYELLRGDGVSIDGAKLRPRERVQLDAGRHVAKSRGDLRLKLVPRRVEADYDPRFRTSTNLFPNIYVF